MEKNIYVILGVPRSGTSVVARGLNALGIDFGDKLVPPNEWNPKGFWEDIEIVNGINQKILTTFGHKWDTLELISKEDQLSSKVDAIRSAAIKLIQERVQRTDHFGFKDPRTARVAFFWQSVFSALKLQDHYIIVLRNPIAAAESYHHLTGVDMENALLLWLSHMMSALLGTENKKRIVVNFDALIQSPYQQLERIKTQLDLSLIPDSEELNIYVAKFLDKKLRHYAALDKTHTPTVAPLCFEIYELLNQIAKDEFTFAHEIFQEKWQRIKDQFAEVYPSYCYINRLLINNKELTKTLRSMQRSFPWKLIYPLRLIDNLMRARRKIKRDYRRTNLVTLT